MTDLLFEDQGEWTNCDRGWFDTDEMVVAPSVVDVLKERTERLIAKSCLFGEWKEPMLELMHERRADWWEKHADMKADELAYLLRKYAMERAERDKQRQKREEERSRIPAIKLTMKVAPPVLAVIERTQHYLDVGRPPSPFREMPLKRKADLSARSKIEYERATKQIAAAWDARGVESRGDMIAWLAEIAAKDSRSSYNRSRAVVRRFAAAEKDETLALMVQSLPPYAELCRILGREPSRRSSAITEARRAPHDERTYKKLLGHLSPEYQAVISLMRATGARAAEAASIRLEERSDGVKVSIESVKTGARRRKNIPAVRTWMVPNAAPESVVLRAIAARYGAQPAEGRTSEAIRAAWRRARMKEGLNTDPGWDLHSLRHGYASIEKKRVVSKLAEKHGAAWREKLFGADWRNNPEYQISVYGELGRRLGHTNAEMVKIYG